MRVLITGATGFIGRRLVARLSGRHEVSVLVRGSGVMDYRHAADELGMDLAKPLDSSRLPPRLDAVIHLAQANVPFPESSEEMFAVNTASTMGLLEYCRRAGAKQFVLASSGDVYGQRNGASEERDAADPKSFYANTKRSSELLVNSYADYFQTSILRLFHPYGPGQRNRLIPRIVDEILQRRPIKLNLGDHPYVTPMFIDDVLIAFERTLESPDAGVVNVSGNEAINIRELAETIARLIGKEPVFEPTHAETGDLMGNNELMKRVLGEWKMIALVDGLSRTMKGEEEAGWQARV